MLRLSPPPCRAGDKKTSRLLLHRRKKSRIYVRGRPAHKIIGVIVSYRRAPERERERERESNQIIGMTKKTAILFRRVMII